MGPLKDIVVIDLTRVLAGPFCTMTLADMGAEVIKIERPETGDDSRAFGPHQQGESAYFMSINRGKKSLTLNLKSRQGKDIFKRLIQKADVVVENFKPGVMKKLGLDYEKLAEINPRLIYCASSGFGHSGPYSKRPAYDLIIQGMGGLMSITGPNAESPTKVGSSIADIFAGVFSAIGILGAIHNREKTGKGQMVDVAMLDCMVSILENAVARYTTTGQDPVPIGNRHPSIAPFTSVKTSDGFVNIACGNDLLWQNLCKVLDIKELANDERFVTNPLRCENMDKLIPILTEKMEKNTTDFWLEKLEEAHVPAGPINKIGEVLQDPQVIARNMLVELEHPIAGKVQVPGTPIKYSETNNEIQKAAPTLGQNNNDILSELGYSQREIENLLKAKVI
jgi:CoA:oxalate CoA-transferase